MEKFEKKDNFSITWGTQDEMNFIKLPINYFDCISDLYSIPSKDILIIETKYDRRFILFTDNKNPSEWIMRELVDNKLYSILFDLERNDNATKT